MDWDIVGDFGLLSIFFRFGFSILWCTIQYDITLMGYNDQSDYSSATTFDGN